MEIETEEESCTLLGVYNIGSRVGNVEWKYKIPYKPSDCIRFVFISDTHSQHQAILIPEGDVLIHGGDFTNQGEEQEVTNFNNFLGSQPHKYKIVISGNHDLPFDQEFYTSKLGRSLEESKRIKGLLSNCIYLQDSEIKIENIRIYGSPWSPSFHTSAFMANQEELRQKWSSIPSGTDILITHGPPRGHGSKSIQNKDVGCEELLHKVQTIKPLLHLFGHIHEGYQNFIKK